jgi:hypothetical protein
MDQMRECLEGFVKSLQDEYNQMKLTDGNVGDGWLSYLGCAILQQLQLELQSPADRINELAETLIADLGNADPQPTMCRLRRLCTNLKLSVSSRSALLQASLKR